MVEYSIEDFFRWLQRIKKEFEDFEDNGDWCMSEKRFKLIKPLGTRLGLKDIFIKDTQEDYYYNTKEDVVDLLNGLSEENEQLRQIMNDIVVATDETYTKNTSMFKVTVVLDFEKYMEIRRCIE